MSPLALVIAGAAAAGFVQGLSGFAFGLVATAFWAWGVAPQIVGPLVVSCSLVGQILFYLRNRQSFVARRARPLILGAILGIPAGVALLPHLDQAAFKGAVGLLLTAWCPVMLLSRNLPPIRGGGTVADGAVGAVAGVMAGVAGLSGPPVTLWCTLRGWDRDAQRAVFQSFFTATHAIALGSYAVTGLVTLEAARMFALAVPAMLVPGLIGMRLYDRLDERRFRMLVLGILLLSGIALLLSAGTEFAARHAAA